jgi:hypothetical protein
MRRQKRTRGVLYREPELPHAWNRYPISRTVRTYRCFIASQTLHCPTHSICRAGSVPVRRCGRSVPEVELTAGISITRRAEANDIFAGSAQSPQESIYAGRQFLPVERCQRLAPSASGDPSVLFFRVLTDVVSCVSLLAHELHEFGVRHELMVHAHCERFGIGLGVFDCDVDLH